MNTQIIQCSDWVSQYHRLKLTGEYADNSMPDWVSQLKLTGEYADDSVFWFSTGVISPSARAVSSIGRLYSTRIPIALTLSLMMLWGIQRKTKQNKSRNKLFKAYYYYVCYEKRCGKKKVKNRGSFWDSQPYPPF